MRGALPDGAHLWLHAKPLDAAIRQVPVPYRLSGCHGQRFQKKNTTKTQLLPSTTDRQKKAIKYQDPSGTLYYVLSATSPDPNPYATSQVEAFSYVLSYQGWKTDKNFEKLLSLNEAQDNLWCIYVPVAVAAKLLPPHCPTPLRCCCAASTATTLPPRCPCRQRCAATKLPPPPSPPLLPPPCCHCRCHCRCYYRCHCCCRCHCPCTCHCRCLCHCP
jgi:hypothetical protein